MVSGENGSVYATVDATTDGAAHGGPQEANNALHASNSRPHVARKASHGSNPGHGCGLDELEPAGHKKPSEHDPEQFGRDRPVALPNVPCGHNTGDDDPAGQNDPMGQGTHAERPDKGPNAPMPHTKHAAAAVCPVMLLNVPGIHAGCGTPVPVGQKNPRGHGFCVAVVDPAPHQ